VAGEHTFKRVAERLCHRRVHRSHEYQQKSRNAPRSLATNFHNSMAYATSYACVSPTLGRPRHQLGG
jgi:hypothetical protein